MRRFCHDLEQNWLELSGISGKLVGHGLGVSCFSVSLLGNRLGSWVLFDFFIVFTVFCFLTKDKV